MHIVQDGDRSLAKQFGAHGIPYYILLDEAGDIVATQNGSGGEASLRNLLSRAGLRPGVKHRAGQESASSKVLAIEPGMETRRASAAEPQDNLRAFKRRAY
jgi:hypothetical protein